MTSQQWRLAILVELVLGAILASLFLGTHSPFLVPVRRAPSAAFSPAGRIPWRRSAASVLALVVVLVPFGSASEEVRV